MQAYEKHGELQRSRRHAIDAAVDRRESCRYGPHAAAAIAPLDGA
jgi:hypothetical protein